MSLVTNALSIAQCINKDLVAFGVTNAPDKECVLPEKTAPYDELITNSSLRKKTEKLFKDGHHARAVEEAYKLLDNIVQKRSGLQQSGSKLMHSAFSQNSPILKLNEGISASEIDEQIGYMNIFAGCMTGIRNPRAHDSDWEDTEQRALQLLVFANHLIERVILSEKI